MSDAPIRTLVQVAKAIGHPARLRILAMLRRGPLSVCQITSVLASVPSTVSGHLLELRRAGLVAEDRQGKFVFYELTSNDATRPLLDALFARLATDHDVAGDAALAEALLAVSPAGACDLPKAASPTNAPREEDRLAAAAPAGAPRP
ncbi:MAG: winged helix-turn-helix domain-containing protein [Acidobacteria bacterium]|nr:winged helix-turn-helix domain-containing protein [Acidobacteriota bacterium]